eukprot:COSAG05_NODE_370_length_10716_cov_5.748422_2_plen_55_part_00
MALSVFSVDQHALRRQRMQPCDAELSATVFLIYQMVFHNRNSHARMHGKAYVFF